MNDDANRSAELNDPDRHDLTVLDVLAGPDDGARYKAPDSASPSLSRSYSDLARTLAAGDIDAEDRAVLAQPRPPLPMLTEWQQRDPALLAAYKMGDPQLLSLLEACVGCLDETEREVVSLSYGLAPRSQPLAAANIGVHLSLSRDSVVRIRKQTLDKLRTMLADDLA
jgi:hypothetical protein